MFPPPHFLVQFNRQPLVQTILTSHPGLCLPYIEATVLREVVQYFSPASLRARHVYAANVAGTAILFPIHSFPSLAVKPYGANSLHRFHYSSCVSCRTNNSSHQVRFGQKERHRYTTFCSYRKAPSPRALVLVLKDKELHIAFVEFLRRNKRASANGNAFLALRK